MEQGHAGPETIGDPQERMKRAYLSLDGLSIGDSLGSEMCWQAEGKPVRHWPDPQWKWTDDTEMALSITSVLGALAALNKMSWLAVLRRISTRDGGTAPQGTTNSCNAFATGRIGA